MPETPPRMRFVNRFPLSGRFEGSVLCAAALFFLHIVASAHAGDRLGVTEAMKSIHSNWPDAFFSIDIKGFSQGDAIVAQPLHIEYEAARNGHLAYIHVSSHGDITLARSSVALPTSQGTEDYTPNASLGTEQLIVLFSDKPLDVLFPNNSSEIAWGSDREHALSLVKQVQQLQSGGLQIAARKSHFNIATQAGGTEYTTRSIIYEVESAGQTPRRGAVAKRMPSRIEFEFDSDKLTQQGERDLDEFGEALVTREDDRSVVLEGHTDSVGTDEYNVSLSQRRAEAARQYLVQKFGINQSRITAKGLGKSDPLKPNDNEADRSHNRRVDFVWSFPGER